MARPADPAGLGLLLGFLLAALTQRFGPRAICSPLCCYQCLIFLPRRKVAEGRPLAPPRRPSALAAGVAWSLGPSSTPRSGNFPSPMIGKTARALQQCAAILYISAISLMPSGEHTSWAYSAGSSSGGSASSRA